MTILFHERSLVQDDEDKKPYPQFEKYFVLYNYYVTGGSLPPIGTFAYRWYDTTYIGNAMFPPPVPNRNMDALKWLHQGLPSWFFKVYRKGEVGNFLCLHLLDDLVLDQKFHFAQDMLDGKPLFPSKFVKNINKYFTEDEIDEIMLKWQVQQSKYIRTWQDDPDYADLLDSASENPKVLDIVYSA